METSDVVAILTVAISIVALCLSSLAQNKVINISKTANTMQKGLVEMQIRTMITDARNRYEDIVMRINGYNELDVMEELRQSSLENYMNAYDEACAKYIDDKVDKERFKKLYFEEIKQIVECEEFRGRYAEPQTKYKATVKVYNEWNNRELNK